MKGYIKEFKEFISGGNMIELAVAVILAGFIGTVIKTFTEGVVLNLVAAIVGKPDFNNVARIKLRDGKGLDANGLPNPGTYLEFGQVITAIFTLIVVGLVLFMIIKAYNKMKKSSEAEPAGPTEVELLTEIRDSLKARG
ncbi:MAG: large conductance mechanosensitive channel protein MscL [Ilumatobacteraceae bacterium]